MRYFTLFIFLLCSFTSLAQVDTCDVQIHAVSDTPCSRRILHLGVEADTLPNTSYTWEGPGGWTASGDSVTRNTISATGTGNYIVTGIRGICTYKDTINVFIRSSPSAPYVYANNSPLCAGDTLIVLAGDPWLEAPTFYLDPAGNSISSPFFSNDSLILPDMQINMAGIYSVYVTGIQGCISDTTSFNVEVDSCTLNVANIDTDKPFIPTLLRSSNPVFKPIFKPDIEAYKMQIYDQSGRKVFETNSGEGWNRAAYSGIYFYLITTKTHGYSRFYKGKLTLL